MTRPTKTGLRLTIERSALAAAVKVARVAVASKATDPLTGHFLLDAGSGAGLTVTATDLEIFVAANAPAVVDAPGRATVPAALAVAMLAQCPAPTLTVALERGRVRLTGTGTTLALPSLDPEDFPAGALGGTPTPLATCATATLREAVARVAFAAADKHTVPALVGVYCEFTGGTLTLTAANGYRISTTQVALDHAGEEVPVVRRSVPAGRLAALLAALPDGPLAIGLAGNCVALDTATVSARIRTIEGAFPNFRDLLARKAIATRARVPRDELRDAARLAGLAAESPGGKGGGFTRLDLAIGPARVTVRGEDSAEAEVAVALLAPIDAPCRVRMDAGYLAEALGALGGAAIELRGDDPVSILVVAPTDPADPTLHGIVPMALTPGEGGVG
jgi:DNA polymerase-3 subunit beta